ncbi:MAG: FkbM family methyltransferase [Hyphomonadaceae bacterium]
MAAASWTPPSTLEERLKRLLIPPRLELKRITAREFRKGEPELGLLPYLADPARAAIDAGANRGIWAEALARICPRVFAYEPNPKLFPLLKAAARGNVECFAYGLSDADGAADLLVPGSGRKFSNQGATLNPAKIDGGAHATARIETRRLDSLSLPPIGFIKIDVEGHELAVIEGGRALIARDKPVLIVEIEARHTKQPLSYSLDHIKALGYRLMFLSAAGLKDENALTEDVKGPRGRAINNFIFLPT